MSRVLALSLLLATACGGSGQYGFAREYEPLGDEEDFIDAEQPIGYEDVHRDPAAYRQSRLGWFGVVTEVNTDGAVTRVAMTFRTHQERHLCSDELSSSCRVTVSERAGGPFTALVDIREEDQSGQDRLGPGSLLKVYGAATGEFDDEGGPIVQATWYRHWPRGTYVTTAAAGNMRR